MLISEIVTQLHKLKKEHGDCEVVTVTTHNENHDIESIDTHDGKFDTIIRFQMSHGYRRDWNL